MDGWVGGWMDGWMGGSKSRFKDCLQQSKTGNSARSDFECSGLETFGLAFLALS